MKTAVFPFRCEHCRKLRTENHSLLITTQQSTQKHTLMDTGPLLYMCLSNMYVSKVSYGNLLGYKE